MDSYCLQQSVSEVFNNQLCMQFTLRLMLHEGMSHLQCHHLQMGLAILSDSDYWLGSTPLQRDRQNVKLVLFYHRVPRCTVTRHIQHCLEHITLIHPCSVVNGNSHGS